VPADTAGRKRFVSVTILGLVTVLILGQSVPHRNEDTRKPGPHLVLEGLTRPCKRVQLALRVSGVIEKCPIEQGQRIREGQIIVELESGLEKAAVEVSRLKAESDHEVRAAELTAKLKEYELSRLRKLASQNAASEFEVQEAQCAVELAKVQIEAARFSRKVLSQELKRDEAALAQRRMEAPFEGFIWRVLKQEGAALDELEPVAELVNLDPIWVEANVPAQHFGQVGTGQAATVTIAGQSRAAKVIAVDPLVDASSATFRVKLEVPNQDGLVVAGVPATVRLEAVSAGTQPAKAGKDKGD
jgi:RND family efflux transporter MFP subunit